MKAFKVLCINDADQPAILPPNARVVEGQEYTVVHVAHMQLQSIVGFKLLELPSQFPYEYFKSTRFVLLDEVVIEDKAHLEEAI